MTHILVVEDDVGIALGLADDLELEGYEVTVARDGEDALSRARGTPFDLIVLDLMLPRKDGFQVCRELRRSGLNTPVIMLTARAHEAEKVMGLEMGADDYVTKPFSPAELRARIKSLLRRAAAGVSATYRFGDVEADFERFELRRARRPRDPTELRPWPPSCGTGVARSARHAEGRGLGTRHVMTDRVIDTHIVASDGRSRPTLANHGTVSLRGSAIASTPDMSDSSPTPDRACSASPRRADR
jgi:CheY-like chemotaxis protein